MQPLGVRLYPAHTVSKHSMRKTLSGFHNFSRVHFARIKIWTVIYVTDSLCIRHRIFTLVEEKDFSAISYISCDSTIVIRTRFGRCIQIRIKPCSFHSILFPSTSSTSSRIKGLGKILGWDLVYEFYECIKFMIRDRRNVKIKLQMDSVLRKINANFHKSGPKSVILLEWIIQNYQQGLP